MDNNFVKYICKFDNSVKEENQNKKPTKLTLKFKVSNIQGTFNITDIMLQECKASTGYTINTKEMLKRSEGMPKHYNILIRGANNGIIVNNDGNVSSGLNFDIVSGSGTTGAINIETLHKTKNLYVNEIALPNEKLSIDSFSYNLINNGITNRNYKGSFLGIPSGFGLYNVDMNNRDAANFIFKINEYDKKDNY